MPTTQTILMWSLYAAAGLQLAVALLNLRLVSILDWRSEVQAMSLLVREVFHVHKWFISITLAIFGVITLRFAPTLADPQQELAIWLSLGIAAFWGIRAVMQVTYYSSSHWRGKPGRTAIHVALILVYGSFSAVYLLPTLLRA